jgi:coatomer protein complex subunit alpha (xenin)
LSPSPTQANKTPIPEVFPHAALLQPPTPIFKGENWPLLAVGKSLLSDLGGATSSVKGIATEEDGDEFHETGGGQWGEDDDDLFGDEEGESGKGKGKEGKDKGEEEKKKGWGDDDLELSDDEADAPRGKGDTPTGSGGFFTPPMGGTPPTVTWCADSSHAADHLAAGSAESALQLLHRQIALVNAVPLRVAAQSVFLGATCYLPGVPLAPSNRSYLVRESTVVKAGVVKTMPQLCLKVGGLLEQLKAAYKAFTNGQFGECKSALEVILTSIPLVQAASRTETNDLKELLDVSREYLTAIRVKQAITDAGEDVPRSLELSAYFTHCNLQPAHLMLALKTAMASAFKSKNYINAASFARRLLELPDMNR